MKVAWILLISLVLVLIFMDDSDAKEFKEGQWNQKDQNKSS